MRLDLAAAEAQGELPIINIITNTIQQVKSYKLKYKIKN